MRSFLLLTLFACGGGTVRPTCDRADFNTVDPTTSTTVGSLESLVAGFNNDVVLDRGTEASLVVVVDGEGSFADHTPGRSVTGLPPRARLMIGVRCDDELLQPVQWTLSDADGVLLEGSAELHREGVQDVLDGGTLVVHRFDGGPLEARLGPVQTL